jgi:hypothetical protein
LIKNINSEEEINIGAYIKFLEDAYARKKLFLNMNIIIIINIVSHSRTKSEIISEKIPLNFEETMGKDQNANMNLMIIKNFI